MIEEPTPPEPAEAAPQEPPARRPVRRPHRPVRIPPPTEVEITPEPVEPPTTELPALEPRGSSEQEAALRRQIAEMQEDVEKRIARLDRLTLSSGDRKTLEDARAFLAQSSRAMETGDLQRSSNLARKASLLVAALEQQP